MRSGNNIFNFINIHHESCRFILIKTTNTYLTNKNIKKVLNNIIKTMYFSKH
jgi:hypothetical protein